MIPSGERGYKTYVRMVGAVAEAGCDPCTHVRVDVRNWENRRALVFSLTGVERRADGIETSLLLTRDRARAARVILESAPRFNRKRLTHWAAVVEEQIREERGDFWDRILAVVHAHGAVVAK